MAIPTVNTKDGKIVYWTICVLTGFLVGLFAKTASQYVGYFLIAIIVDVFAWRLFVYESDLS